MQEEIIDQATSEYADYEPQDWVMVWIMTYGFYDGAHHKTWVLDQIARILKGTPVIVKRATWPNGEYEDRFSLGDPSVDYLVWVAELTAGEDGPNTYPYDEGIAP